MQLQDFIDLALDIRKPLNISENNGKEIVV